MQSQDLRQKDIYLDNCATTKVCEASANAVVEGMRLHYGNAASLHKKGFEAEQLVTNAKKVISKELSCSEEELYFTSGATESNNLAILGAAAANRRKGNKIITTAIEHASVTACFSHLQESGYDVVIIKPNKHGEYDPADFFREVDEKTVLVSCMFVNNETGLRLPIQEIAQAVKMKNENTLVHVDAVQGFMRLPLKLKTARIDLLSASGHKVNAPKGIGLLYIRKGVRVKPLFYGGGQQNNIRVGTESVPLIAGFAAAVCSHALQMGQDYRQYEVLKAHFLKNLEEVPGITVNSNDQSVPYIVNISAEKIRSEVMLHYLEQFGIYVSSGSACSKGKKSHVLEALGVPTGQIDTALRISFGPETIPEDLDYLTQKLKDGINTLIKLK